MVPSQGNPGDGTLPPLPGMYIPEMAENPHLLDDAPTRVSLTTFRPTVHFPFFRQGRGLG